MRQSALVLFGGSMCALAIIAAESLLRVSIVKGFALSLVQSDTKLSLADPACERETNGTDDEIYFLSCGGIF